MRAKRVFTYEELYNLVNDFIDTMVDISGINTTIKYLIRSGISDEQISYLNFDADSIGEAHVDILEEDSK